ncbi:MAG: hypothetical protein K5839_01050 [Treponemataceae bacterium]|nr:hypothetical protein [Treponemataceae bacterium]
MAISVFAFSLLLLNSCSNLEEIEIDLSQACKDCQNDNSFQAERACFLYLAPDYQLKSLSFAPGQNFTQPLKIKLAKNQLSPLLCVFQDSSSRENYSGFLYPFSCDFSLHGAYAAYVFIRLLQGSYSENEKSCLFLSYFNWKRFCQKIEEYENPFLLDTDYLCQSIAAKTFSVNSFRLKNE